MDFSRDVFDSEVKFVLEEASGEVDGKHIIGKVKGTFFKPDGTSRNVRFYPVELWEKVLCNPVVQNKLKERRMFGTIGHNQPIDDDAIREGKISHFTTSLSINGKDGIGEALIVDTPAGRSLNTLLRAGCKLYTSSRAYGKFNGSHQGTPVVDPDTYQFETFDFVIDPGFAEANPRLVESLEMNFNNNNEGELKMTIEEKILEKVVNENATLRVDLSKSLGEIKKVSEESEDLEKENTDLKAKCAELEQKVKDLEAKCGSSEQKADSFKDLGSPQEIKAAVESSNAIIQKYKEIGTVEDINKALDESKELLNQYRVLGTPGELNEAIEKSVELISKYKELGTPELIGEALDKAEDMIIKYKEYGSIEELGETFDRMEKVVKTMKNENDDKKIKELSTQLGVTEEAIRKLWGKVSQNEICEAFKKANESSKINEKYKKPVETVVIAEQVVDGPKSSINESRLTRLMNSFS